MSERIEGKIKIWMADKGWGFVETKDGDVFMHRTGWTQPGTPRPGEWITFRLGTGLNRKPCCVEARPLHKTESEIAWASNDPEPVRWGDGITDD